MKEFTYILILLCSTIIGCKEQTKNIQKNIQVNTAEKIEGLTQLSEKWIQDSTIFWTKTEDSTWIEIRSIDTISISNYTVTERYQLKFKNSLTIKKFIDFDPKLKTKISETDLYIKELNPNLEAKLGITYNYITETYYSDFLDSTGTVAKKQANRTKADSLLKTADKEGMYLCGTAYNDIVWENIPFLPIPRKIDIDSALLIIEHWTKK